MKKLLKKITRYLIFFAVLFLSLSVFSVLFYRFVPVPLTLFQVVRTLIVSVEKGSFNFQKDWESKSNISSNLSFAIIASEDQKFPTHFGFDVEAIQKAIAHNRKKNNKTLRGGSTISQQLAKNLYLWPARSYVRKALEVYYTLLIEVLWSKSRIMEVYVNSVEWGPGVFGAEAAAQRYFHKSASKLTASEAALLAVCLPNPIKYNPTKAGSYLKGRQSWVLRQMNNLEKPDFLVD